MPQVFHLVRPLAVLFGSALALSLPSMAVAQNDLAKDSPFGAANNAPAAAAPGESLEFAGVSSVGKKTDIIIFDKNTKKRRWIPIGETVDGITALKYDDRLDQAVVRANGVEKVLTLRKGSGPLNAPSGPPLPPIPSIVTLPAPAAPGAGQPGAPVPPVGTQPVNPTMVAPAPAPAPAGPQTPETIAKQETEARMLVSDLLEIGMAQRKAYEEAQRKAAAGETGPGAPPPVPPAQPPTAAPNQAPAPVPPPAPAAK